MLRRAKKKVPSLNTSSTADISFMLLIFFLLTTSMEMDKGLDRKLPPIEKKEQEQSSMVNEHLIMKIQIDANNKIYLNEKSIDLKRIKPSVLNFIETRGKGHIIQIQSDRKTTYNTYFSVQNEIISAYNMLRNKKALAVYGRVYEKCDIEQKQYINEEIPQRISEVYQVLTAEQKKGGKQ